jgi:CRP-like cAMP-binding protein
MTIDAAAPEIAAFAGRAEPRLPEWLQRFEPRYRELRAGGSYELGEEIVFVVRGRLLRSAIDEHGQDMMSLLEQTGSVIGIERLRGIVVPYQLWAITDVHYESFAIEPITRWIDGLGAEARSLIASALDAAGASLRERTVLHTRVLARLAKFVLDAADHDGTLRLPRFVIARILSMRPETLSRALKELQERGAIALKPRLRVIDRQALEQALHEH